MKRPILADPLLRRCRQALSDHRRRARADGCQLAYRLEDLEALARSTQQCHWCRMPVAFDFHFDHITPISRGGKHALDNLAISCGRCDMLRGKLTGPEFLALLEMLRSLHPTAAQDLTRRLLHGGKRYRPQ
jgi:5-methylcytosine-specific restriction endonuclease McrA